MIIFWIVGLLFGAVFVASDLVSDAQAGGSFRHLLTEMVLLAFFIIGLIYSVAEGFKLKKRNAEITKSLDQANAEARTWKANHEKLIQGLSQAIDEQFLKWNLTHSEKDVALLLIKGLSHKEIANLRNASEKTVRTQATAIYQKSGLAGRSELAAFFLEDLLSPHF